MHSHAWRVNTQWTHAWRVEHTIPCVCITSAFLSSGSSPQFTPELLIQISSLLTDISWNILQESQRQFKFFTLEFFPPKPLISVGRRNVCLFWSPSLFKKRKERKKQDILSIVWGTFHRAGTHLQILSPSLDLFGSLWPRLTLQVVITLDSKPKGAI